MKSFCVTVIFYCDGFCFVKFHVKQIDSKSKSLVVDMNIRPWQGSLAMQLELI